MTDEFLGFKITFMSKIGILIWVLSILFLFHPRTTLIFIIGLIMFVSGVIIFLMSSEIIE